MIYLDNASTTFPKPAAVAAAIGRFMSEIGASPGRGGYRAAVDAERLVTDVRQRLTRLIGGREPNRMVFTASCTDALNMAFAGVLGAGDHVVTTVLEHNSVARPLRQRECDGQIEVTKVPCTATGWIDPDAVRQALTPRTRLVVVNYASNVLGTIQPAREIGAIVREHGALFLLDAAQTMGVIDVDVERISADLLAFPAHKELLGPPGLGGLYVGDRVEPKPWRQGGTGGDSAHPVQPTEWPHRLEAGTLNMIGIAGLQAALDELDPPRTLRHLRAMLTRLTDRIAGLAGVRIVGGVDHAQRVGTLSITLSAMTVADVGAALDASFDIAVRTGLHCAPDTHRAVGTFPDGTVRISPGPFTTPAEIDRCGDALAALAAT